MAMMHHDPRCLDGPKKKHVEPVFWAARFQGPLVKSKSSAAASTNCKNLLEWFLLFARRFISLFVKCVSFHLRPAQRTLLEQLVLANSCVVHAAQ